jgi:hypothetical protein
MIMAKKYIKMNKSGEDKGPINMIIAIIIMVFILVIAFFSAKYFYDHPISNLGNLLPDYFRTNYTPSEIVPCPDGSSLIGYIDLRNNIIFNNEKSVLYLGGKENKQILGRFSWSDGYPMGNVDSRGTISMINVYDELHDAPNREIRYREFPSKEAMLMLNDAFIFNGSICKSYYSYNTIQTAKTCILKCSILDGMCSNAAISGKIPYPTTDCPSGQYCYISYVGNILISENISIKNASLAYYTSEKQNYNKYLEKENIVEGILGSGTLTSSIPTELRLRVSVNSKPDFCFTIDNEISKSFLKEGYSVLDLSKSGQNRDFKIESDKWDYTGEKILFFVAWIPGTNEKAIVKWKMEPREYSGNYNQDNVVTDSEFYQKLVDAKIGSEFYIFMKRIFASPSRQLIVNEFRIVKDSVTDYHIYYLDDETQTYKPLDCNTGGFRSLNLLYYGGKISEASQSLGDTIDKKCKFTWGE